MGHEVTVTRDGRWWVAVVAGVSGGTARARRLDLLEAAVRDLLAGRSDRSGLDPDRVQVRWRYQLSAAAQKTLRDYTTARDQLAEAQQEYEHRLRQAAGGLVAEDLTARDAGYLLDTSFQRISQLTQPVDRGLPGDLRAVATATDHTRLTEAVQIARARGHSWTQIALALGVSRQAARQRFADTLHA